MKRWFSWLRPAVIAVLMVVFGSAFANIANDIWYGVNMAGHVYVGSGTEALKEGGMPVVILDAAQTVKALSIGNDLEMWVVTEDGLVMRRTGLSIHNQRGTGWVKLVEKDLSQIALGFNNQVWALDPDGDVLFLANRANVADTKAWTEVSAPEKFRDISVGVDGQVWATGMSGAIFMRTGITTDAPSGTTWQVIPGGLNAIAVGPRGLVWGINSNDDIFYRQGVTQESQAGTAWAHIGGKLRSISVSPNYHIWGANAGGGIYLRQGTTFSSPSGDGWVGIGNGFKIVRVAAIPHVKPAADAYTHVGNLAAADAVQYDSAWAIAEDHKTAGLVRFNIRSTDGAWMALSSEQETVEKTVLVKFEPSENVLLSISQLGESKVAELAKGTKGLQSLIGSDVWEEFWVSYKVDGQKLMVAVGHDDHSRENQLLEFEAVASADGLKYLGFGGTKAGMHEFDKIVAGTLPAMPAVADVTPEKKEELKKKKDRRKKKKSGKAGKGKKTKKQGKKAGKKAKKSERKAGKKADKKKNKKAKKAEHKATKKAGKKKGKKAGRKNKKNRKTQEQTEQVAAETEASTAEESATE